MLNETLERASHLSSRHILTLDQEGDDASTAGGPSAKGPASIRLQMG